MLTRLRVTQYALIEDAEVEFGRGLNVLTGETGAGKSILIDSLGLLLGARASAETIREGAEEASVEGLFVVEDRETVVRRELRRDRTNRCTVDGSMATVRMLQERAEGWVELHGQHEDQLLLKSGVQRGLLDAYAGAEMLAERVADAATALAGLEREHAAIALEQDTRAARSNRLRDQLAEIEAAGLLPDEEEALAAEATRLRHSAERQRLAGEAALAAENEDGGADGALGAALRPIERLVELDSAAGPWAERMSGLRYELRDLAQELLAYADAVEHDAARLATLEARRDLLFRLKRKYGATVEAVIEEGRAMAAEVAQLEEATARGAELDREAARLHARLADAAPALADAREAAAGRLAAAVGSRLAELGMGEGGFEVRLERRRDGAGVSWNGERYAWSAGGLEDVAFLVAPNPGESVRPLARIASGGELSRILLALKAALAEADRIPTLVFDEIDAGVGGVVAHRVADQLAAVACGHQVIVVTHLAQIAAAADRHLVVEKTRDLRGRSVITVHPVSGDARIREVSRLLGGDPERDVSRHHAEELLAGRA